MEVLARSGDSLWYYSSLFMIPLNLIIASNPDVNPSNIKISEKVAIPGYQSIPYTIKNGDTIFKIAASKGLASDALMLLNQELIPNQLTSGEIIHLPNRVIHPIISTFSPWDFKKLSEIINDLNKIYPFITVSKIGKSVLGSPIQEIRIGNGTKKVHMNASFHANEWITTMVLMVLLNKYLLSLTNGNLMRGLNSINLFENVELSIVPMVNPDGVDLVLNGPSLNIKEEVLKINEGSDKFIHWKANIRGVDLNKQYPANWEIASRKKRPMSPAPRDYPGSAPLTEPEAIAMADLAKRNLFDCILAFHTQGEEFYWGYEGHEPPESEYLANEFERISGYQSVRYVNSHAGYKDWYIQEFKRPGFTLELGRGINPLPLSQFPEILKRVEGIFIAALSI
ncbi:MAG: M14 family metallopeptidase [Neobacillus sp.]